MADAKLFKAPPSASRTPRCQWHWHPAPLQNYLGVFVFARVTRVNDSLHLIAN